MTALVVLPRQFVADSNGDVRSGAKLYVYDATTVTPRTAYTTSALAVAHSVPVVSLSTGLFPAIYVDPDGGNYKLVLKDSSDVTLWTEDNIPVVQPLDADAVGQAINPRTQTEIDAPVVIDDYAFREGEAERYESLADALLVSKGPHCTLQLAGETYAITAALTVDEPVKIVGVGIDSGVSEGSIVDNTTNDVAAFTVTDQRCKFEDFGVLHEAATKFAFSVSAGAYFQLDNIVINCNEVGYGGVVIGDETAATTATSWQSVLNNVRVDDYTDFGIRVNTTGHTHELRNCSPRSTVDGAHGAYINTRNVNIYGGQYGANNVGGINIYFYNVDAQAHHRGSVSDVVFENVSTGEYAVVIDGATHGFNNIQLHRLGIQLSTNAGTLVKFGRTSDSLLSLPSVLSPTGGGKLCEWGEFSADCELICDLDAATAPITVHASATRAVKKVVGRIPYTSIGNITTNANLTTTLVDGLVEGPPGFVPVHAYGAWNIWLVTLADDAASSFTLPLVSAALVRSRVSVYSDGGVTFAGTAVVDGDSGGAAISAQGVGADFVTTTGALAGTTSTDVKVSLSVHTDNKIYLENRSGASRDFTVLITPVINGT